jgi:hypothetical protein
VVSGRSFFEWEGHAAAVLRLKFGGGDAAGVVRSLVGLGLCVFFLLDLYISFLDLGVCLQFFTITQEIMKGCPIRCPSPWLLKHCKVLKK